MGSSGPAFVLTMASYYGTLSAARCLGDRGVRLIAADADRLAPALWSRHVTRRERCPPVRPIDPFMEWLLALGRRDPGHVLYATSDDLAWAFAEREVELRRHFRLLTPSFVDVAGILDKGTLYSACSSVGLSTPRTWFPTSVDDLDSIGRQASFPLIVKPRTQVLFSTLRKGRVVASQGDLCCAYTDFVDLNRHDPGLIEGRPFLAQPMIQEFRAERSDEAIYSLSGFSDYRHGLFVARGALKLEQWPRRAGIGIHFADALVQEGLAQRVKELCEATRFVGVFEAEFVDIQREPMLIDFNPRFFGQLGFDVERALPSPFLAYLAAIEDLSRLRAEVEAARAWRAPGPMLFANRTAMAWTRVAERLVGRVHALGSVGYASNGQSVRIVDAAADTDDWVPGALDSVQQIVRILRHPRSVVRAAMRGD
jgi:predicted ATP-grasp superfamily ATP-dependent carboligase